MRLSYRQANSQDLRNTAGQISSTIQNTWRVEGERKKRSYFATEHRTQHLTELNTHMWRQRKLHKSKFITIEWTEQMWPACADGDAAWRVHACSPAVSLALPPQHPPPPAEYRLSVTSLWLQTIWEETQTGNLHREFGFSVRCLVDNLIKHVGRYFPWLTRRGINAPLLCVWYKAPQLCQWCRHQVSCGQRRRMLRTNPQCVNFLLLPLSVVTYNYLLLIPLSAQG